MPPDKRLHPRMRLSGYDYSLSGAYFITVVTQNRASIFGVICDETMVLSPAGLIVQRTWLDLPRQYPSFELGSFIVMPNHIHGIIWMIDSSSSKTVLGDVVRSFKSNSARRIRLMRETLRMEVWQRNYYDHIIRNEHELERIDAYIRENPRLWSEDRENPFNLSPR